MSNSLDPDKDRRQDPNCLQRLSADNKSLTFCCHYFVIASKERVMIVNLPISNYFVLCYNTVSLVLEDQYQQTVNLLRDDLINLDLSIYLSFADSNPSICLSLSVKELGTCIRLFSSFRNTVESCKFKVLGPIDFISKYPKFE